MSQRNVLLEGTEADRRMTEEAVGKSKESPNV
jgi:hypothetical protein